MYALIADSSLIWASEGDVLDDVIRTATSAPGPWVIVDKQLNVVCSGDGEAWGFGPKYQH